MKQPDDSSHHKKAWFKRMVDKKWFEMFPVALIALILYPLGIPVFILFKFTWAKYLLRNLPPRKVLEVSAAAAE